MFIKEDNLVVMIFIMVDKVGMAIMAVIIVFQMVNNLELNPMVVEMWQVIEGSNYLERLYWYNWVGLTMVSIVVVLVIRTSEDIECLNNK